MLEFLAKLWSELMARNIITIQNVIFAIGCIALLEGAIKMWRQARSTGTSTLRWDRGPLSLALFGLGCIAVAAIVLSTVIKGMDILGADPEGLARRLIGNWPPPITTPMPSP